MCIFIYAHTSKLLMFQYLGSTSTSLEGEFDAHTVLKQAVARQPREGIPVHVGSYLVWSELNFFIYPAHPSLTGKRGLGRRLRGC